MRTIELIKKEKNIPDWCLWQCGECPQDSYLSHWPKPQEIITCSNCFTEYKVIAPNENKHDII